MPVLDEASYNSKKKTASLPDTVPTSNGASLKLPNGDAKSILAPASVTNLIDFSLDDAPVPSPSGGNLLPDFLNEDLTGGPSLSGFFLYSLLLFVRRNWYIGCFRAVKNFTIFAT